MGLATPDGNIPQITPIGRALLDGRISLIDYSLILLSKLFIYNEDKTPYANILGVILSKAFSSSPLQEEDFGLGCRTDLIFNALILSGLLEKNENNQYRINPSHRTLAFIYCENAHIIEPTPLSNSEGDVFRGAFQGGIFDIIKNISSAERKIFETLYPNITNNPFNNKSIELQQIFYGAPGTGKSHEIKYQTQGEEVIRTTFHPDSDYSTFVGAYKPTMKAFPIRNVAGDIKQNGTEPEMEERITYEFVSQAFLRAYVNAWKYYVGISKLEDAKKQYLIIEEINRGNCAQIFGDLFQLLDRNDFGFSDYYIHADQDMKMHLAQAFDGCSIDLGLCKMINRYFNDEDVVKRVLKGEILLLPNNLYIWATMNTSDQSLFPIDSAFKRRWDWKYMPIAKGMDNAEVLNWVINIDDTKYDWWTFISTINKHILETTNSEDKQLGFFFCKAKGNVINAETFVGKVIFYLWNDVFKDFGFDDPIFIDNEDVETPKLSFDKFYQSYGKVNIRTINKFLANLGIIPIEEDDEDVNSNGSKFPKYSINGSVELYTTPKAVLHIIEDYAKQHENISVKEMIDLWNGIAERRDLLVNSWQPSPNDNQPFADKRRTKIEWKNGSVWMINGWTEALFKKFMENVKQKLDITIERVN